MVTAYHDNERFSSMGVYDQQTPQDPCLSFTDYLNNTENLLDTDIVAWVTIGTHHLPTSEDAPTTATPGHRVNFVLHPYNFFDADPSMTASDAVYLSEYSTSSSDVNTSTTPMNVTTYGTDHTPLQCQPPAPAESIYSWGGKHGLLGSLGRRLRRRE